MRGGAIAAGGECGGEGEMNVRRRASTIPAAISQLVGLNSGHLLQQVCVERFGVRSGMRAPVTVRTQCNDVMDVIWAAVADAQNVMRFQVRLAICPQEWCRGAICLAVAGSSAQNPFAHVFTTEIGVADRRSTRRHGLPRIARTRQKFFVGQLQRFFIIQDRLDDVFEWAKLEDNGSSHSTGFIRRHLPGVTFQDVFAFKAQPLATPDLLKQQQAPRVRTVFHDRLVAPDQLHITHATGAEIVKCSIFILSILVAVGMATGAGDRYDQVVSRWSDDAALRCAAEAGVDIGDPVINFPAFKSPRHASFVLLCLSQCGSGVLRLAIGIKRMQVADGRMSFL